ncbi:MAG: hypothetical protein PHC50_03470 [Candidatus Cloacimonetes bacterium]|nr:hypothetical protein [Candidatus Cloacimonadota bacterium]
MNTDTAYARYLRQRIQAHRIARLKWPDDVFIQITEALGFGRSLRELPEHRLSQLHDIIAGYRIPLPEGFEYDSYGRYMYALQQRAGLSDEALRYYMVFHFQKSHWNILDSKERISTIRMLNTLIQEQEQPQ